MYGEMLYSRHTAQRQLLWVLNNLKRDTLETQHPKFKNSGLGFIESVYEYIKSRKAPTICMLRLIQEKT